MHDATRFAIRHVVPLTLVGTLVAGYFDYATGVAITFIQLVYILPIAAGTWLRGQRYGALLACLATLCACGVLELDASVPIWTLIANAVGCLGMFVFALVIVGRLRHYVEREQLQRHAAVEQLRHADRLNVIGVLAAGVAHELGTPLNVIAGTAELLDAEPINVTAIRRSAATIIQQTDRISAIIRHLLEFGRRGTATRGVVELQHVAREAAELLGSTARKRGAKIDIIGAESDVRVRASDAQVEQVLSNLLLNAIQAMPRGGTVRVRTGITTRRDGRDVDREFGSVSIEDEGTGIPETDLPRIFDPFFTTKGVGEGTGLGLSVSYGIVHDHGGSIEVHSRPGSGTSFVVLLPLAQT